MATPIVPAPLDVKGVADEDVPAIGDKAPFVTKMNLLYSRLNAFGVSQNTFDTAVLALVLQNELDIDNLSGSIDLAALQAQITAVNALLATVTASPQISTIVGLQDELESGLTKELRLWVASQGALEPVTEIVDGIVVTALEDTDAGANSNYEFADANAQSAVVRIKMYLEGGGGTSRFNRDTTSGTSILTINRTTGAANASGGGTPPTILSSTVTGNWAHVRVQYPTGGTSWDIRPHTGGVGRLRLAVFERYAE